MYVTINLGKELGQLTSSITDVFTTKDYHSELITQYMEHVDEYYSHEPINDFRRIYLFKKFISQEKFEYSPCEEPLVGLEDSKEDVREILRNRRAYKAVFNILKADIKSCKNRQVSVMMSNVMDSLYGGKRTFRETAEIMDRHLGNFFTTAQLIDAILAYGRLSGLVDYYLFQEGK